jgi:hypothetical protein
VTRIYFFVRGEKTQTPKQKITNRVSGLIAYNLIPEKPPLNLDIIDIEKVKEIAQIGVNLFGG